MIFCLVRTEDVKTARGYFIPLIDMDNPRVELRPDHPASTAIRTR